MNFLRAFAIVVMVSVPLSCATIISGSHQRIHFVTDTPGAYVFVNKKLRDTTPCVVKIARDWDDPGEIRVEKPGFQTEYIELKRRMNELSWLNFVNPFGWVIDGLSNSMVKYRQPDTIMLIPVRNSP